MIDMDDKSLELDLQEFTKCFYRFMDPKDDSSHEINTFIQFLRSNLSSRSVLKVSPLKTTNFLKNYKMQDTFYRGANLWLLKPVDCNRGRGIELFNTLDGLKNLLLNGKIQKIALDNVDLRSELQSIDEWTEIQAVCDSKIYREPFVSRS